MDLSMMNIGFDFFSPLVNSIAMKNVLSCSLPVSTGGDYRFWFYYFTGDVRRAG
jgi:hypothetical protein